MLNESLQENCRINLCHTVFEKSAFSQNTQISIYWHLAKMLGSAESTYHIRNIKAILIMSFEKKSSLISKVINSERHECLQINNDRVDVLHVSYFEA